MSWLIRISAMSSSRCSSRSSSMICAWVVTSSAVVASSAMSSFGWQARAMAIMTRWRMPPESWCGYSLNRGSAAGRRTMRSRSIACFAGLGLADLAVRPDRLGDLGADPHRRVERAGRVLEDHGEVGAAVLAQLAVGHPEQLGAANRAEPLIAAVAGQQAHDGAGADGLARAGLADDGERPAWLDLVADAVDGADSPGRRHAKATRRSSTSKESRQPLAARSLDPPALTQRVTEHVQRQTKISSAMSGSGRIPAGRSGPAGPFAIIAPQLGCGSGMP